MDECKEGCEHLSPVDMPVAVAVPMTLKDLEMFVHKASSALCATRDRLVYLHEVQGSVLGEINHLNAEERRLAQEFSIAAATFADAEFQSAMNDTTLN